MVRPRPITFRALFAALLALTLVLAAPARAADADKGVIANLISRALSSPTMSVSIGAVEGVLSSDATIKDIVLSDRQGPWLKVDTVRLIWSRLALISRRLEVDRLTIGHIQVLRRALPSETPPPDSGAPQPILPELPLKVVVKDFAIQELSLGEPVVGVAARLDMAGRATLGPPSEGLDLSLSAHRLDAGGQFKALLTYVPQTDKLTVSIDSEEPAGGIFAHLANLPGLPPAKFTFAGEGPLDNFDAKLDFAAGADVWAKGDVQVARQGSARRLSLDLNSRIEGMAPAVIQPVFAGETTLKGDVLFNDDSSVVTPGLHLVSANARLDIEGRKAADNRLDVKIHAGAIPGSSEIGKLDLNATIAGPATAPTVEGEFDAGAIHGAQGSLDRVTATFHARPSGDLTETATQILFDGQGTVKGLALADPALAEAFGGDFTLTARGSTAAGGLATFDTLDLVAPKIEAQYSGLLGPAKMHGRLHLTVGDLSRFSRLAGGALAGEARIAADLDGAPSYGLVSATIDAHAQRLATPYALLDKAIGGELGVTGVARTTPGGGFGFSNLVASGRNATARLDGDYRQGKADVSAAVDIPQATAIDPRVDGKLDLVARLTGAPDDLGAEVKATLGAGRLLDRKTTGVTFAAVASHLTGNPDARGALSGDIDGQPLAGSGHIAEGADGGWSIDDVTLSLASAKLAGALAIGADRLATGEIAFSAKNLDDLSPLVLTKLGGALQAKVTASADSGRQSAAVVASSDRMNVGDNRLEGLKVDLTVADFWGARAIEGTAKLARAVIAGESIGDVGLNAKAGPDFTELDFSGAVRGLAVKARGRLSGGKPARLDLASLSAEGHGRRIALAHPATLAYGDEGLDIQNFTLAVELGARDRRWAGGGEVGPQSRGDRNSAGGGGNRCARPRPLGRRRRRGDPHRDDGGAGWRLAPAARPRQRAAVARLGPAGAGRCGFRAARRRPHDGRSHGQRRATRGNPHGRLGAARSRRRARPQGRRKA